VQTIDHSDVAEEITRRELLKMAGKVVAVAAVSSVFSPIDIFTAKAASTKRLSFWMFYAPGGGAQAHGLRIASRAGMPGTT
jgi:hypothetical protein